ncbi:cupin domain-containing protein [Kibdelosporangium lantanae]|uniref:Cupin domain-containing protein n=1 Tax=Kibdelosporangium lantanae TaxID=1497396 RepID=A0ABW3M891_9PSEU
MQIVNPRTMETPNARMDSLATPSLGSTELCTWRVTMTAGTEGPVHAIDREQVWMPVTGRFTVTADGRTEVVETGQSVILPAGETRQIRAHDGAVEAVVCMAVGGFASIPGGDDRIPLPWAQ